MTIIKITGRKPRVSSSDGHGYDTKGKETPPLPQRNGQRMKEKEFNEAVQNYLHVELTRCGIEHKDVAPGRNDVPLATRAAASNAFKADLHIDIHANAFNSILDDKAGGIETFYYAKSAISKQCAQVIHKHIMQGTKMKDRGIKDGSHLYMINKPKAISILPELGFMDNIYDVGHLLSDSYRKECAVELAKGVCEIFGIKYVPEQPTTQTKIISFYTGGYGGASLTNIHNLLLGTQWWYEPIRNGDGTLSFKIGGFAEGSESAKTLEKFLKDHGYWYSVQ